MKYRDVDPKIKRFFPWALFLVMAVILMLFTSYNRAHSEEDIWACYGAQRYEAMSSAWPPCTELSTMCLRIREYLQTHTKTEARLLAAEKHLPHWLVAKGERCVP